MPGMPRGRSGRQPRPVRYEAYKARMRRRIVATAIVAGAALALLTVFVTTLMGSP